ncbi:MAG: DUF6519 domain-containing protein [bacterium]|nr:DUF6519 domain-containing protein [bacterium]
MAADYSRDGFRPEHKYSGVRMQQGRGITDADWNEQVDVADEKLRSSVHDAIGLYGAPAEGGGFKVSPATGGAELSLSPGRFYVGGTFVQNDTEHNLSEQSDLPGYAAPDVDGVYLAYLEVGERTISYLEDGKLREPALGGPDTSVRTRPTAQVRLLSITEAPEILDADSTPQAYLDLLNAAPGRLKAFANSDSGANPDPGADLCSAQLLGGYRLPDNRLYRIEIHAAGAGHGGGATYKWSRDNGSVRAEWLDGSGAELRFRAIGQDSERSFAPGQWIELLDEGRELRREPGTLARIAAVEQDVILIDASTADGTFDPVNFAEGRRLIRRWDMRDPGGAAQVAAGKLEIEGGLQIEFASDGNYRTGDAWLIPARSVTRGILWPCDETGSLFQTPHRHRPADRRFARLAFLRRDAGVWSEIADARVRFASLAGIAKSENQVENKVNRFGDTMTGTLNIEADLNVDLDANFGQSVSIDQNLTVKGDFTIEGDLIARDTQHQPGDVLLGDQDEDTTILHGALRSLHSSGALEIDDAVHIGEDAAIDGALNLGGDADLNGGLHVVGDTGLGLENPEYRLDVDGTVRATNFIGDGSLLTNVGQERRSYYGLLPEYLYPTNDAALHGQSDAFGRTLFYTTVRDRERLLSPRTGMFFGGERILLDDVVPADSSGASSRAAIADGGPAAPGRTAAYEKGPTPEQRVYRLDGRDDIRIVTDAREVRINDSNDYRPVITAGGYVEFTGYMSGLRILAFSAKNIGTVRVEWFGAGGAHSEERFDGTSRLNHSPNWNRFDDAATLLPHLFEAPGGPDLYTLRIFSGDRLNLYGIESVCHRADGRIDVPEQAALINGERISIPAQDHEYLPDPFLTDGYALSEEVSGYYDEGLDAWPMYLEISVAVSDHQAPAVYAPPLNVHDHVLNTATGVVYRVCYLKNLVAGEHQAVSNDKIVWEEVCTIDRSVADISVRTDLNDHEILYSVADSRVYRVLSTTDGSFANSQFHHRRPYNGGRVTWNIHPTARNPDGTAVVSSATVWMPPVARAMLNEAEFLTLGARGVRHFTEGGVDYLIVGFHYSGSSHNVQSRVFRRAGVRWQEHQSLSALGVIGVDTTVIGGTRYAFLASYHNGSNYNTTSKLYRWNGTELEEVQDIATNGPQDGRFFAVDGTHYLAITHHIGNAVVIHEWDGSQFQHYQTFGASRPIGIDFHESGGTGYLFVAEHHNGSTHNINSRIYRHDGSQFVQHQTIPTNGVHNVEAFTIGGDDFFFVPNHYNGSTFVQDSHLYRWDGANFVLYQRIPTVGPISARHLEIDGRDFLAVMSANNGSTQILESTLFEWDGQQFREYQKFYGEYVHNVEMFHGADGESYLAFTSYRSLHGAYDSGTKVMRWNGERFVVDGEYLAHDERGSGGQSRPVFAALAPDFALLEKAADLPIWEFGNGDRNGATQFGFDTLTVNAASNRAYTFPDGGTNLVGRRVGQSSFRGDHIEPRPDATVRVTDQAGGLRFSFPGCGLRMNVRRDGSLRVPGGHNFSTNVPVVADLPYGAHVWEIDYDPTDRESIVRIDGVEVARGGISHNIESFEVYQPRRAVLPDGWINFGDYLLPAEIVQATEPGVGAIARGVRRVHALHDVYYTEETATSGGQGAEWALVGTPQIDDVGGLVVQSGNAEKIVRYRLPFFGTGAILRFRDDTDAQDFQIRLNGSSNLLAYATAAATGSLNAATGMYTASRSGELASSVSILALPRGEHMLEVEATVTAGRYLFLSAIDLVEPLHRANHFRRHESPLLYELIGGGAGIDRRDLRLFDESAHAIADYGDLRGRSRVRRPRVWANLGKDDNSFPGAQGAFRMNMVRGRGSSGIGEFGTRGVVYGPGQGKFYILEDGTYEIALNYLANGNSSIYILVNNKVLMYTYSHSSGTTTDSSKSIQAALRRGDTIETRVHFSSGFANGDVHNQLSLRKLE